jgi:hypothetical protein
MNRHLSALDKIPLRHVLILALVVILICSAMITLSLGGAGGSLVRFEEADSVNLADDKPIAGWASLDRDSYFLGEHAGFRVRVLYRPAAVIPDFDTFKRNLGFLPFDQLNVSESLDELGNGISEYRLEYTLHVVGARKPGSYPFNPVVLPYANTGASGSDLHTLRITRPDLRIGSLYPWNAGLIPLRQIRGHLLDHQVLRQTVMLAGALVMLGLLAFLLWRFGRRRQQHEMSGTEQLWYQFRQLAIPAADNRLLMLAYERIFTRLLQQQTSMDPEAFWSGHQPVDSAWHGCVDQARNLLWRLYQPGETTDADVQQMHTLLADRLTLCVKEQRLIVEQQPSVIERLKLQRPVAAVTLVSAISGVLLLILAVFPDLWLAAEIRDYNRTVDRVNASHAPDEDLLLELQAFAATAEIPEIRAAAFYNSGTTRARYSLADGNAATQSKILDLVFQAETAEDLMQTLLLSELSGSEEDVVKMMIDAAEKLLQAELDLQSATRVLRANDDVLRNLELVTRWRHAILTRLLQLRELFSMKPGETGDEEIISEQGIVDIINAKIPEEYDDAEMAKDNSHYIIFERF